MHTSTATCTLYVNIQTLTIRIQVLLFTDGSILHTEFLLLEIQVLLFTDGSIFHTEFLLLEIQVLLFTDGSILHTEFLIIETQVLYVCASARYGMKLKLLRLLLELTLNIAEAQCFCNSWLSIFPEMFHHYLILNETLIRGLGRST